MERRLTSRTVSLDWITRENHCIQPSSIENTYERLKTTYEMNLRRNWVEELENPNHILEQLSLAACLIELWKTMYDTSAQHPGFVDIACGNGILVFVLLMEGYTGTGFDACRRKSWNTFPAEVQSRLQEKVIIPKPFLDVLESQDFGIAVHAGAFPENTFIISDHADELTVWTPILAALASPLSPLPFFVIPCCSRSLAGSSYRYSPSTDDSQENGGCGFVKDVQPCSGDLRALRAAKMKEKTESGFLDSMIGSLAAKTATIAEETGGSVEKAWLRTPGAINMALIGRQNGTGKDWPELNDDSSSADLVSARLRIMEVIERECFKDGGIQAAAQLWVERVNTLLRGNGTQHSVN